MEKSVWFSRFLFNFVKINKIKYEKEGLFFFNGNRCHFVYV